MKFPRYWTKGSHQGIAADGRTILYQAYGWSSESMEEAARVAERRAKKAAEMGQWATKKKEYEYGDIPFREEIVDSIQSNGNEIGVISRNRYGSLVLNTDKVMFVDLDVPGAPVAGFFDAILTIFSAQRKQAKQELMERYVLQKVEVWTNSNPDSSYRLYRTHGGFRMVFTDQLHEPKSSQTKNILEQLGCDALYMKLTDKQECFRARLTPKPWRCGMKKPPSSFPWENEKAEQLYRHWESEYGQRIGSYSTCALHKEVGRPRGIDEITRILQKHDQLALHHGKPLA